MVHSSVYEWHHPTNEGVNHGGQLGQIPSLTIIRRAKRKIARPSIVRI
jgi:hypothetical protein